jgi:hypothetical protein
MQLGEAALVEMIPDWEHDKDNCPFCNAATLAEKITNDLTDSYDEDEDPSKNAEALVRHEQFGTIDQGVRFKNDASKLGKALGGRPEDCKVDVPLRDASRRVSAKTASLPVTCAAHHLIPGNAALKESSILELLRVDGPEKGNIGYNVNKATNGVWLPGNYALRGKWGETLQGGVARIDYVRSCMLKYGQFHDSHTDYSKEVIKALDAIAGKYNSLLSSTCPSCKKKKNKAKDPKVSLFLLVGRIDWLSNTLHGYVRHYDTTDDIRAHWKKNLLVSDTYGEDAVDDLESIADVPPPAKRKKK